MMDPACRSRCVVSPSMQTLLYTGAAGGAVAAAVMLNTPRNPPPYSYRKEGGGFHTHTKNPVHVRVCVASDVYK